MKKILLVCSVLVLAVLGCKKSSDDHGHDHAHFDGPPHGGTPVMIGDHGFHLELVLDREKGVMQSYVLDDHMEHYEPVSEKSFLLNATVGGQTQPLTFERKPDPANPQAAKSMLFEARADWLKTATNFDAVIPEITLNGKTFKDIKFSFPKGSRHEH